MGRLCFLQGIMIAVAAASGAPSGAQTAPSAAIPAPTSCSGPEHRQFDFWVGDWDLYQRGKEQLVGHNLIEKLFDGCVIRETWTPLRRPGQAGLSGGSSLNHYDRGQGRWHQTWIDSSNTRVIFEGGMVGDKMVLAGFWPGVNGPGKDGLVRMTYVKISTNQVDQIGEVSTDHGITWNPSFGFTYKRRNPA